MKNYAMFKYDFIFGDHFAKASAKAKLLYINLSFYADMGFVSNPRQICKSMGYDESVLDELVKIDELLTQEGRTEMFITSYFVHNTNFNPLSWTSSPFAEYWKGKLWLKKNRIATLNQKYFTERTPSPSFEKKTTTQNQSENISDEEMRETLSEFDNLKKKSKVKSK